MGYLTAPETDQLPLPSEKAVANDCWVKMKRKASYGDSLAAQSAMLDITQGTNGSTGQMVTEMELGAYMRTLVSRMVVEWNITDENGNVVAITEETVELLEPEDGDFLGGEAQKRLGRRPEAEQVPFGKHSGRRSRATK